MEGKKRLDISKVLNHLPPKKEERKPTSIRLTDREKEKLILTFGSVQKGVDALLLELNDIE